VLRLHGALSDVEPVNPAENVGATAVGVATGVGLLVPRVDLGRAAVEVEMLDGVSGERVVAVVAERRGRRFGGKIKGAKRWGDAKAAFRKWAKDLRKRLDELHADAPAQAPSGAEAGDAEDRGDADETAGPGGPGPDPEARRTPADERRRSYSW
jgi:hypothetical protein